MFLKREKKDDCLIAGYVVCDQKKKEYNGKPYVEFGISMGKDEQGENLPIVNVAVWDRELQNILKGDRVLACGKLRQAEKDGKVYYSLNADFCIKETLKDYTSDDDSEQPSIQPIGDDGLPF